MPALDKKHDGSHRFLLGLVCVSLCVVMSGCGDKIKREILVTKLGQKNNGAGVAIVQKHDTLWDIATRFDLPLRDIIALNKIKPPFTIQQGQRLQLPPPRDYTVKRGDTLYDISRMFETDMASVARLNSMHAPYKIQIGQVLRMPSPSGASAVRVADNGGGMIRAGQGYTNKNDYLGNASAARHVGGAVTPSAKPQSTNNSAAATPAPKPHTVTPKLRRSDTVLNVPKRSSNGRFAMPVNGPVISSFGPKKDGLHNDGINIGAPRGAAVKAAENGVVAYSGDKIEGYGNLVLIRHAGGYMSAYAHLGNVKVIKGQKITKGQVVGTVGASGNVDKPQLHFEIRKGSKAINPQTMI